MSEMIKMEVARLLEPYQLLLAGAKSKADRQDEVIAGKEAEIASLKEQLAVVKAQTKSSAVPAAVPSSTIDPKCQPLKQMQRDLRKLSREVNEAVIKCIEKLYDTRRAQSRINGGIILNTLELFAFRQQLEAERERTCRFGGRTGKGASCRRRGERRCLLASRSPPPRPSTLEVRPTSSHCRSNHSGQPALTRDLCLGKRPQRQWHPSL